MILRRWLHKPSFKTPKVEFSTPRLTPPSAEELRLLKFRGPRDATHKVRKDATIRRKAAVINELPVLMQQVNNTKTKVDKPTFDKSFLQMWNTFARVLLHNKASVAASLKSTELEAFENAVSEYQRLLFTEKDSQSYPWDSYTDYKEYCESPPMVVSYSAIKEAFKLNTDPQQFELDTFGALCRSFVKYKEASIVSMDSIMHRQDNVDMTNPANWYPAARAVPRTVYLHIGPTNSGKTYSALQAFKNSSTGYYAGPLRLLAKEVYNRMKTSKRPCNLITGEEVIEELDEQGEPTGLSSGTVEMMDLKRDMDVAIIDEIQMIEDRDRGWAWTNAFLGVRAKEVHCCGDPNSEGIIRRLVKLTGDRLRVVRYERLSPLEIDEETLDNDISKMKPGDCLVAFSKKALFHYKAMIEERFKAKCAVIYGSLPADTRSEQAMKFNDPDSEYKFLVASDAVGMGLNLAIRRVVFSTVRKFDGVQEIEIPIAQIKQIGGRAGRYKIAANHSKGSADPTESVAQEETGVGQVTTLKKGDLEYVKKCMASATPRISRAGLFPQEEMLREFAMRAGLDAPFYQILQNLQVSSRVSSWFFLTDMKNLVETAKLFSDIDGLLFGEMLTLSKAPVALRSPAVKFAFMQFCLAIARGDAVNIMEIPNTGIHKLQRTAPVTFGRKSGDDLEEVHRVINLYLWLSYRFPVNLLDRKGAFELKRLCEDKISQQITLKRR